jgi:proline iminopeptidase
VGDVVKVVVGDGAVTFDVEGAWLVPMGAWMVERPTVIVIGDPQAARRIGSPLADLAQVVYVEDRMADVAGLCAALEIQGPLIVGVGAGGAPGGPLPAGFPGLLVDADAPDAGAAARRFVQSVQPGS